MIERWVLREKWTGSSRELNPWPIGLEAKVADYLTVEIQVECLKENVLNFALPFESLELIPIPLLAEESQLIIHLRFINSLVWSKNVS